MAALDLFIARQAFIYYPEPHKPHRVRPGAVARKGHPVITAQPDAWEPLSIEFDLPKPKVTTQERDSVPGRSGNK